MPQKRNKQKGQKRINIHGLTCKPIVETLLFETLSKVIELSALTFSI